MSTQHARHSVTPPPTDRPLTVAEVMTQNVITIGPDAPLSEAVTLLADSHISGLGVVDGHHRLIGVLSAQDVLAAEAEVEDAEARARLMSTTSVRDIMTKPPHSVRPELELRQAALEMEYADIHRVFVEMEGKVVGVLSRSDINRVFARNRR